MRGADKEGRLGWKAQDWPFPLGDWPSLHQPAKTPANTLEPPDREEGSRGLFSEKQIRQ